MQTNDQLVSDLRLIADWLEKHPDVQPLRVEVGANFHGDDIAMTIPYGDRARAFAAAYCRAIGRVRKDFTRSNYNIHLIGQIDGRRVCAYGARSTVCTKRLVTKQVEEWDCSDPILAGVPEVEG